MAGFLPMLAASAGSSAVQHLLNERSRKQQAAEQAKLNANAKLQTSLGGNAQAGQTPGMSLQTSLINDPAVKSLLEGLFSRALAGKKPTLDQFGDGTANFGGM